MNDRESILKTSVKAPPGEKSIEPSSPPAAAARWVNQQIAELEFENLRLQRLVAELLLKNQKLRAAARQDAPVYFEDESTSPDPRSL